MNNPPDASAANRQNLSRVYARQPESAGLPTKRFLLELEGALPRDDLFALV